MPVRVRRVARTAVVAEVERQELGRLAGQLRRHRHPIRVDGEMHERPASQGDVRRVPVAPVLVDGVLDVLVRERVLQLRRGRRDAVHQQDHVEGLGRVRLVGELAGDAHPVRRVERLQLGSEAVRRLEERQRIVTPRSTTPWRSTSTVPRLSSSAGQTLGEASLRIVGVVAVATERAFPTRLTWVAPMNANSSAVSKPSSGSKCDGTDLQVATGQQRRLDALLEAPLVDLHAATPGTSSSPVTAAVIKAWRCSRSRIDLAGEARLQFIPCGSLELPVPQRLEPDVSSVEEECGTCFIAPTLKWL